MSKVLSTPKSAIEVFYILFGKSYMKILYVRSASMEHHFWVKFVEKMME